MPAWGSNADLAIWLLRSLSETRIWAITRCGFCFSASCTASFKVRCTAVGGVGGGCWAGEPCGNDACKKTKSRVAARRTLAAMSKPPNARKQDAKNVDYK